MNKASRVQKLLNDQEREIALLKNRVGELEAALRNQKENCTLCGGNGSYLVLDGVTKAELWDDCPSCFEARAALGEKKDA